MFKIKKKRQTKIYWTCCNAECQVKGYSPTNYLSDPHNFVSVGVHNHPNHMFKIKFLEMRNETKEKIILSNDTPRDVTTTALLRVPDFFVPRYGSEEAIYRTLRRAKNASINPNPNYIESLGLCEALVSFHQNEPFYNITQKVITHQPFMAI